MSIGFSKFFVIFCTLLRLHMLKTISFGRLHKGGSAVTAPPPEGRGRWMAVLRTAAKGFAF